MTMDKIISIKDVHAIHIWKKFLVHVFVFHQLLISVCGQPLDRPPEGFPCGTIYCTRWGFDTCITSGINSYCLPCDHDQLQRHCGTKDEYPGCGLYCADLAIKELKNKLEEAIAKLQRSESNLSSMEQKLNNTAQNLTITTSELHTAEENLTDTTQKLQHSMLSLTITTQLLHQTEQNLTEMSHRLQQTRLNLTEMEQILTRTEKDLRSCRKEKDEQQQNYTTLLIVIPVVCSVLMVVIPLIVFCKERRHKRPKQNAELSDNEDTSEDTSLMVPVVTATDASVNSIRKTSRSDSSSNHSEACRGHGTESCYGKQKLTNVPPTNEQSIAIQPTNVQPTNEQSISIPPTNVQPTNVPGNSELVCNQRLLSTG